MARINTAGVFIELIATVVLIVLLAVNIVRGPQVVSETGATGSSGQSLGYLGAFLDRLARLRVRHVRLRHRGARSARSPWTPGERAPRRSCARFASFLLGGLILLFALMCVPDLATASSSSTDGLQYVVLDVLGPTAGKAMLWCVLIAVTVCALAVHTAAIRLAFAMAGTTTCPPPRSWRRSARGSRPRSCPR